MAVTLFCLGLLHQYHRFFLTIWRSTIVKTEELHTFPLERSLLAADPELDVPCCRVF